MGVFFMATIPVATDQALSILNLKADDLDLGLFEQHKPLVLQQLEKVSIPDSYQAAKNDGASEKLDLSFRFSYSFYLLHSTAEFLNLNTSGRGIVKTTGFDDNSTQLLSGKELQAFKKHLEIRALTAIEDYLNDYGKQLLNTLRPPTYITRYARAKVV
jgi:hypothetical protein